MKNLHVKDSYNIWSYKEMQIGLSMISVQTYDTSEVEKLLNRSWTSIYIEWYLHNIGYYITRPFICFLFISRLNIRLRDVDINEHK